MRLRLSPPRLQLARRSLLSSEPLSFKKPPVHWNELSLLQLRLLLQLHLLLLLPLLLLLLPGGARALTSRAVQGYALAEANPIGRAAQMITEKATRQEPAPNQIYALFWFSGIWDASGLCLRGRKYEA